VTDADVVVFYVSVFALAVPKRACMSGDRSWQSQRLRFQNHSKEKIARKNQIALVIFK
jgi:hypothetical protein